MNHFKSNRIVVKLAGSRFWVRKDERVNRREARQRWSQFVDALKQSLVVNYLQLKLDKHKCRCLCMAAIRPPMTLAVQICVSQRRTHVIVYVNFNHKKHFKRTYWITVFWF